VSMVNEPLTCRFTGEKCKCFNSSDVMYYSQSDLLMYCVVCRLQVILSKLDNIESLLKGLSS